MKIMYETKRIILTPFNREIANNSDYEKWFYDRDVTKFNHWGLFPHGKQKEEAFLDMCESGESDLVLAIIAKVEDKTVCNDKILKQKHIGNLSLQRINQMYQSAEYAITIGDKEYWNGGYGFEASSLLFYHGFNRMNLNRIWTGTASVNNGMNKLALKLGMTKEGEFKDGMYLDGEYVSINSYAILKREWEGELCQKAKNLML